MNKESILIKACAAMLCVSLVLTGLTGRQVLKTYANENTDTNGTEEEVIEGNDDIPIVDPAADSEPAPEPAPEPASEIEPKPAPDPEPTPEPSPEPTPEPQYQPDPFDYNLTAYGANLDFGTIRVGEVAAHQSFTITNTGVNAFPLTYDIFDEGNAFRIESTGYGNMNPGDSASFNACIREDLAPGTYTGKLVFYSANDIRQHHTAVINMVVRVKEEEAYISSVTISPAVVAVQVGKQAQFDGFAIGGGAYDSTVLWSLVGNTSASTSITDGVLTVGADEMASSIGVIATSRQDNSKTASAVANISSIGYSVSIKGEPYDGGVVAGGGSVRAGGSIDVSASPNRNFQFIGWFEGDNKISDSKQLTLSNINEDRYLVAKFQRDNCHVRVSINNDKAGTVTGDGDTTYGSSTTLKARPREGYYFEAWIENNRVLSDSKILELNNITSDRDIQAVFHSNKFNVNVTVYPQDTGKYEGAGKYRYDDDVVLKAAAYDGYEFTGWSVNGQVVSTKTEYRIDGIRNDVNIVANFKAAAAKTYRLTSGITNEGGSIVPSGNYDAQDGSSVTYNIIPKADYKISAVSVDGTNIGAVSSYTFNNIKETHKITVSFEKVVPKETAKTDTGSKAADTKKAAATKKVEPTKAEYTEETATSGALPEQTIVAEEIPEEVEELEGEIYEDDTFTEAPEEAAVEIEEAPVGILAKYNIDEDLARKLIRDGASEPLVRAAYQAGILQINYNNGYGFSTREDGVSLPDDATISNIQKVIATTLTEDEEINLFNGQPLSINIDVTDNTALVSETDKTQMQKKVGYKPLAYFDLTVMKSVNGNTTLITDTGSELEVIIPIPTSYQKENRKYYVLRNHNGDVDVLENISTDPSQVVFKTDRFSQYALAYEAVNINKLILQFAIVSIISLIMTIIVFVAFVHYRAKQRRAKRRARKAAHN